MSQCKICNRQYTYNHNAGHTKEKCNSCLVNIRRFKLKTKCLEQKGGKCQICKYNKCSQALVFHHIDPSQKSFEISGAHSRSWKIIQKELDKCILVCANCHSEIHAGLINTSNI